MKQNL